MDGRRVAMNVLVGAGIGATVPIVAAIALVLAVEYFDPIEHISALIILSTLCAGIGVVVNLPWDVDASPVTSSEPNHAEEFATQSRRYQFDAGLDDGFEDQSTGEHAQAKSQTDSQTDSHSNSKFHSNSKSHSNTKSHSYSGQSRSSAGGRGPRGSFSMSHRRALKILGLDHGASTDAVREAYRQLAKQTHPDQFVSQGDAAVKEATEAFRDLQEAYQLVRSEG